MLINQKTNDFISGFVLCIVTLPFAFGISLASGLTLKSGLIASIIGGTLVLFISRKNTLVAGPSSGLSIIVLAGVTIISNPQTIFLSILLSGILQILFGLFKLGDIFKFIPKTVINAVVLAIGVLIFYKYILILFEFDKFNHLINFKTLIFSPFLFVILITLFWYKRKIQPLIIFLFVITIGLGVTIYFNFIWSNPFVNTLYFELNFITLFSNTLFTYDFSTIEYNKILTLGTSLAIISAVQSLITVEALNEAKSKDSSNWDLITLGIGNIASGILGGLPISYVIASSKLNELNQVKSKITTLIATILLGIVVFIFGKSFSFIPLNYFSLLMVTLGILIIHSQKEYITYLRKSKNVRNVVTFLVTVLSIIFSDLLIGIAIGIVFIIIDSVDDIIEENRKALTVQIIKKQKKNIILVLSAICTYLISKFNILMYEDNIINDLQVFGTIFSVATLYFWEKEDK